MRNGNKLQLYSLVIFYWLKAKDQRRQRRNELFAKIYLKSSPWVPLFSQKCVIINDWFGVLHRIYRYISKQMKTRPRFPLEFRRTLQGESHDGSGAIHDRAHQNTSRETSVRSEKIGHLPRDWKYWNWLHILCWSSSISSMTINTYLYYFILLLTINSFNDHPVIQ